MRHRFLALCIALLGAVTAAPAPAQVSISIGINVPVYPQLVLVPGYPVYYAPSLRVNLFFFDGFYWVLEGDSWYVSSWYNGPWRQVAPAYVPYYVLRVPVRYYRAPPPYFRGWAPSAPPRWGQYWGPRWEQEHRDWDKGGRRAAPKPAPLPSYQKQYSGNRYPDAERQTELKNRHYRYEPRSEAGRQYSEPPRRSEPRSPAPSERAQPRPQRPVEPMPQDTRVPREEGRQSSPWDSRQPPPREPQQPPHETRQPPRDTRPPQQERGPGQGRGSDQGEDRRREGGPGPR